MIEEAKVTNWLAVKNRADRLLYPERPKLTQLRLMKLLYFIQGSYLALYGAPLFTDNIVHADYGLLAENVHHRFAGKTELDDFIDWNTAVKDFSELNKTPQVNLVLNSVYDKFADATSTEMINLIHRQEPWKLTKTGEKISEDFLEIYFKENIVIW